jgi:hypothetical protein
MILVRLFNGRGAEVFRFAELRDKEKGKRKGEILFRAELK